jgi:hypothetical protein
VPVLFAAATCASLESTNDTENALDGAQATACSSNCNPSTSSEKTIGHSLVDDSRRSQYDRQPSVCTVLLEAATENMLLFRITADRYAAQDCQELRILVLESRHPLGRVGALQHILSHSARSTS